MMSLFSSGAYILHSGEATNWSIDCNALSDEDVRALALMAFDLLPPFGTVMPTLRGGTRLATALNKFTQEGGQILIAEDVFSDDESMEEIRDGRNCLGITIFARSKPPEWVRVLWSHPNALDAR